MESCGAAGVDPGVGGLHPAQAEGRGEGAAGGGGGGGVEEGVGRGGAAGGVAQRGTNVQQHLGEVKYLDLLFRSGFISCTINIHKHTRNVLLRQFTTPSPD